MVEFNQKNGQENLQFSFNITTALPDNNAEGMISKIKKIELKRADAWPALLISMYCPMPMTTPEKD